MKERLSEDVIAMRAAKELKSGDYCNLGGGIPLLCPVSTREDVIFQGENGILGYGDLLTEENWQLYDFSHIDATGHFVMPKPGESIFDFLTSLSMMRSGRMRTVLGALQVSEKGDLANHSVSTQDEYIVMGGAMDLAWGSRHVIVTMTHTTKAGEPKLVKELTLPLTGKKCVNLIVTDLAVIEVNDEGLLLKETAPGWSVDEIQAVTEPKLIIAPDLNEMEL